MTEQPSTPPEPAPDPGPGAWTLRRTLHTASAESWDLLGAGGERAATVAVQYADGAVDGVLAVPAGTADDDVHGVLARLTDLLALDAAAGPGGVVHWTVTRAALEDFRRRSPGRRATGVETDLATARARIEPVLAGMFPELVRLNDGGYAVDAGSVRVFVSLRLVEGTVLVRVFSITNLDVPVDGDLPAFLLGLNLSLAVGRFALDTAKRAVWLDHVLTAEQLDEATLARGVATIAGTADRYDDEIKSRFGGRTFREEGSPVEQAATLAAPGMAGGYL